MPILFR